MVGVAQILLRLCYGLFLDYAGINIQKPAQGQLAPVALLFEKIGS